jgi:hypothetical protein
MLETLQTVGVSFASNHQATPGQFDRAETMWKAG